MSASSSICVLVPSMAQAPFNEELAEASWMSSTSIAFTGTVSDAPCDSNLGPTNPRLEVEHNRIRPTCNLRIAAALFPHRSPFRRTALSATPLSERNRVLLRRKICRITSSHSLSCANICHSGSPATFPRNSFTRLVFHLVKCKCSATSVEYLFIEEKHSTDINTHEQVVTGLENAMNTIKKMRAASDSSSRRRRFLDEFQRMARLVTIIIHSCH